MKFSENWLRQHVSIDADSAALERKLTMIGLEVEGTERIGERLDGVVVARIVECARHPDAERLQVCKVDAGAAGMPIRDEAPVVVSGEQPGPGLWRVEKDGHVMWVLGTQSPLPEHMPACCGLRPPLRELQWKQAATTFSHVSRPPFDNGMT